MRESRFLPILLAVSTVGALWLGYEWLDQRDLAGRHPSGPRLGALPEPPPLPPPPALMERLPAAPAAPAASPPENQAYRCRVGQRTLYSDHPCGEGARALPLRPNGGGFATAEQYRTQQERLAALAPAAAAPVTQGIARRADDASWRCGEIAREIGWIDQALRQPHSASEGDRLTSWRKALNDEAFSLRCR